MSGITVPLESQLRYLRRRSEELEKIQITLSEVPDWELMKRVGHQIKGNAATFGFSELTDFGKNLEQAAVQADLQKALEVNQMLQNRVRDLLRAFN